MGSRFTVMENSNSGNNHPFSRRRHVIKSIVAKARSERSFAERIADRITTQLGSMKFLILNAVWFVVWVSVNIGLVPGVAPFDPFPFGLLTTIVSLEAIALSIIVLISQNRAAKVDVLREEIDLQVNMLAEEEITKIIKLLVVLLKKNGIDVTKDEEIQKMITPTDTGKMGKSIEKQIENS